MKVITIKQPWASLIVNGYKKYEFRSWKTKFRGEVLIHSSKQQDKEMMKRFEKLNLDYPAGVILGKVTITDCLLVTPSFEKDLVKQNELVYGASLNRGGYAFKIENIFKFDTYKEVKGNLGFWNYNQDIK